MNETQLSKGLARLEKLGLCDQHHSSRAESTAGTDRVETGDEMLYICASPLWPVGLCMLASDIALGDSVLHRQGNLNVARPYS